MPNKYKRFIIPVKTSTGGGGRCLCELLPNGSLRVTLALKGLERRPLNLWIFDGEKAVVYPKTLYPQNTGVLELRGIMPSCGLENVCGIALTDESMASCAEGFTGKPTDWRALLQKGSMAKEEPITDEEFKDRVKGLVKELDNSLHGGEETAEQAETPEVAEDIDGWQRITPKEVAGSKRLWKYAKNPFVTAEFNKFKHLLYREDEKFCFLAVPCMQNERFAGAAQGFRMFERHGGNDYAILKCEK